MPTRRSQQQLSATEIARREAEEAVYDGNATLDQVATTLLSGVDREEDIDWVIRRYLLTDKQRALLAKTKASAGVGATVVDVLNGRLVGVQGDAVYQELFTDWNRRLGRICFGMDGRKHGEPFIEP